MKRSLALLILMGLVVVGSQNASEGTILVYAASLDGPSESPPVASPGTGTAIVTIDDALHTMRVQATFSGLIGTTTVAHIHAPTAIPLTGTVGVATHPGTFPGFPVGVNAGSYDMTFDLTLTTVYTSGFLALGGGTAAGAEALLISSLNAQKAYFNLHSTFAPGGEIRGFLIAVPEPSSVLLLTVGGLGIVCRRLRRKPLVTESLA